MLVCLVSFIVFLCIVHIIFNCNSRARVIKKIPGPRDDFIFGNALAILRSSVELMKLGRQYASTWDGIFRIWIFPLAAVVIYNPDDVETIMSNNKYNEKGPNYKILKPWLGDGLLLSNGAKWHHRRKILTPTFHFNILRKFSEAIEENSQRLVKTIKRTAGTPIDVVPVMSEFTLNTICETAMGTRLNEQSYDAGKSYKECLHQLGFLFYQRLIKVHLYNDFLFNLSQLKRKQKRYLKIVHSFSKRVIQQRKDFLEKQTEIENVDEGDEVNIYKKNSKPAMLDLLLSAERKGLIDKNGVQEEVDTFMFEGHDTTASGLSLCFMLLANHKDVQDKITAELMKIFGDSKRPIKMEDLSKMKYMECCIKESMRLYPPVHFISRKLSETTVLSNYTIPAETHCHILIYDLHHRADLFPNPEQFDPDRFLPENCAGRHPYAYIPFSAGPRNCIGQKFAMMEMKMAVAQVMREFELEPVTRPEDVQLLADVVLRNNGPVYVNFRTRL